MTDKIKCPTCGAPMDGPPFVVDLDTNTIIIDGEAVLVTPMMAEICYALDQTYPRVARREYILATTHSLATDVDIKIIDVVIHNLRKRISHTRLRIKTIWGRGLVFALLDTDSPDVVNNVNVNNPNLT